MKEKSITKVTLEQAKRLEDLTDYQRLNTMSDEEIEQNALDDSDNQPINQDLKGLKRKKSIPS